MARTRKKTEESIEEAVEEIDHEQSEEPKKLDDESLAPEAELPTRQQERRTRKKKLLIAAVVAAILIGIVAAVPFLRYAVVGAVYSKSVSLTVVDSATKKPVSGATVTIGRQTAVSNTSGVATFANVSVGDHYMTIEKKYYETAKTSLLVPIFSDVQNKKPTIKATGRTISVSVKQTFTKKALSGVEITLGDATAATDESGVAHVVVAVNAGTLQGSATLHAYNQASFSVDTTKNDDQTVDVAMTPTGSLYYLSKATGVIDLMKSNLDGSGATVVVQGTGKELDRETMIVASSDWRYIALQANRDGNTKLYLVDTKDNSLSLIDGDAATFTQVGWIDQTLVYQAWHAYQSWQPGQVAIKLYDASARKQSTLVSTQASGTGYYDYLTQSITTPIISDGVIEYGSYWAASNTASLAGKKTQLIAADIRGITHTLKEFAATMSVSYLVASSTQSAYASVYDMTTGTSTVYQITGDKVMQSTTTESILANTAFPTYYFSATGTKTAWSESRDGKYYVFIGDSSGAHATTLPIVDYRVYGWYGDDYVLLTKNGSELYIYPVGAENAQPYKVTDYHKPTIDYMGVGYGAAS